MSFEEVCYQRWTCDRCDTKSEVKADKGDLLQRPNGWVHVTIERGRDICADCYARLLAVLDTKPSSVPAPPDSQARFTTLERGGSEP